MTGTDPTGGNARAVERAARATLRWSLRYTRGIDPQVAARRQEEILSDLHEHTAWAAESGVGGRATARSIRSRMLRGIARNPEWQEAMWGAEDQPLGDSYDWQQAGCHGASVHATGMDDAH